jgi:HEAT repeat protein
MSGRDAVAIERLGSADARVRGAALAEVARRQVQAGRAQAVALLADPDEVVRAMAALALDRLGVTSAVPALLDALDDPAFAVRSAAGWALVHFAQAGARSVVPLVDDVLRATESARAKEMARLVLACIGTPEASARLADRAPRPRLQ